MIRYLSVVLGPILPILPHGLPWVVLVAPWSNARQDAALRSNPFRVCEPRNPKAFARRAEECDERDWPSWLEHNLAFPFEVERVEDHAADFVDPSADDPFRYGHRLEVLAIETEDDVYGVIVRVREGRRTRHVPLADLEVTSDTDGNDWPVRE